MLKAQVNVHREAHGGDTESAVRLHLQEFRAAQHLLRGLVIRVAELVEQSQNSQRISNSIAVLHAEGPYQSTGALDKAE